MNPGDLLLILLLAGLALGITAVDLLLSLRRHRRRLAANGPLGSSEGSTPASDDAAARRESIRRRLAAIQVASEQPETSP